MCLEGIAKCKKKLGLYQLYADLAMEGNKSEAEKLRELFKRRQEICRIFSDNIEELTKLANTCIKLAKYEPAYSFLYNDIVSAIMRRYIGKQYDNLIANKNNRIRPKVCFIGLSIKSLGSYYGPVIKYINPCFVDLVFIKKYLTDQERIEFYNFEKYNILYGDEHLVNYDCIVCPDLTLSSINKSVYEKIKSKLVILHHGVECSVENYFASKCALLINEVPSELYSEIVLKTSDMDDENRNLYKQIEIGSRCEVAHTGLYHLEKFIPNPNDRQYYKRLLKEKTGYPFEDKPIVILLEDAESHAGQTVYCLNKLCAAANVIFKPLVYKPVFARLNPKVIIYTGDDIPWSDMRYAVDFILAGYRGGTLISSLQLGLDVIPYYSRIEFTNSRGKGKVFDHFNSVRESDPKWTIHFRMRKILKYFDLLKPEKIIDAITGNEYRDWLHKTLPKLLKEAFGDYTRPEGGGAARLTAEYIMRFARDGTLGKDCKAVYLKGQ